MKRTREEPSDLRSLDWEHAAVEEAADWSKYTPYPPDDVRQYRMAQCLGNGTRRATFTWAKRDDQAATQCLGGGSIGKDC